MSPAQRVVVFLGPTLSASDALAILPMAEIRPPAVQGDIYRALDFDLAAIVVIDGVFHQTPSLWQREIVDALDEGVLVFGASSMGALRAAEVAPYGMVGWGRIFEWYRDGIIEGDDEVALLHGDAEDGYIAMSEPMVNIRATLARAEKEGVVSAAEASALVEHARKAPYPERTLDALLTAPVLTAWSADAISKLGQQFRALRADLKRDDAIGLFSHVATLAAQGALRPRHDDAPGAVRHWEHERATLAPLHRDGVALRGQDVIDRAIGDRDLVERLRPELSQRRFLLEWAEEHGVSCPKDEMSAFTQRWETQYGIVDRREWLLAHGLTPATYRRLLSERALVHWLIARGPEHFGLSWDLEVELLREIQLTGDVPKKRDR